MRELVARVNALLRRVDPCPAPAAPGGPLVVTLGPVELDRAERRVRRDGEEVHLTPIEFDLLVRLAAARARCYPRDSAGRRVGLGRRVRHPHRRQPHQGTAPQARPGPHPHGARRRLLGGAGRVANGDATVTRRRRVKPTTGCWSATSAAGLVPVDQDQARHPGRGHLLDVRDLRLGRLHKLATRYTLPLSVLLRAGRHAGAGARDDLAAARDDRGRAGDGPRRLQPPGPGDQQRRGR